MIPHEHDETADLLVLSLKAVWEHWALIQHSRGAGICDAEEGESVVGGYVGDNDEEPEV